MQLLMMKASLNAISFVLVYICVTVDVYCIIIVDDTSYFLLDFGLREPARSCLGDKKSHICVHTKSICGLLTVTENV